MKKMTLLIAAIMLAGCSDIEISDYKLMLADEFCKNKGSHVKKIVVGGAVRFIHVYCADQPARFYTIDSLIASDQTSRVNKTRGVDSTSSSEDN